ncbi:MAG: polysulfide reductase NrfD [Coriobacteriia bacterium]|nr:polysulfide reductase NrfD [Coriobacteriia bacterium]
MDPVFSPSVVWYLFLGGTGSGAYAIATFIDFVRHGRVARLSCPSQKLTRAGILLGFGIVLLGVVFLLSDLGRIDRAYTLFTAPTFSIASIGAYAILLFSVCTFYGIAVRYLSMPEFSPAFTKTVELAGGVFALAVMAYAGVLLASIKAVSFWQSPFIPALFVLSSFSTGVAVLMVCAPLRSARKFAPDLRVISHFDMVIIATEVVALAVFMMTMYADPHTLLSVQQLMVGAYSAVFWLGYVMCGLLVPLIMLAMSRRLTTNLHALVGVLLLVGGYCLRYCVVNAGAHDAVINVFRVLSH